MTDMATMPVRELIAEVREIMKKPDMEVNVVLVLTMNTLMNRLEQEANRADEAEAELAALRGES